MKTTHRACLALTLPLLGVACHGKSPTIDPDRTVSAPATAPMTVATVDAAPVADAGSTQALARLAESNNAFGLDVYRAARKGRTNLALSPLSLSMALTLVWGGAKGETATQLKTVLHQSLPVNDALDGEASVLAWIRDPAQTVTLRVANRLFGEKTEPFEATYLTRANAAFGAALQPMDFIHAAEPSRLEINAWVATATDDRIKDLLPARSVTPVTRLVLANALYFLGTWDRPFKPEETTPAPFHLSAASTKDVPTMHETDTLSFAKSDGVSVLSIPYAGGDLAMVFVLPDAVDGLAAVESRLSVATLATWTAAMATARVKVALPSFELSPTEPLAMRDLLIGLGMPLAFDRVGADFTGIANPPRPDDRLFLGDLFHKAYVKVDEHGTEAAAATAGVMRKSMLVRRIPPVEFTADHPFLFLLRDVGSGAILFLGRVGDPSVRPAK